MKRFALISLAVVALVGCKHDVSTKLEVATLYEVVQTQEGRWIPAQMTIEFADLEACEAARPTFLKRLESHVREPKVGRCREWSGVTLDVDMQVRLDMHPGRPEWRKGAEEGPSFEVARLIALPHPKIPGAVVVYADVHHYGLAEVPTPAIGEGFAGGVARKAAEEFVIDADFTITLENDSDEDAVISTRSVFIDDKPVMEAQYLLPKSSAASPDPKGQAQDDKISNPTTELRLSNVHMSLLTNNEPALVLMVVPRSVVEER